MYWLTGILGIILASAPFVLGYTGDSAALWTSLSIGVVMVGSAGFEWLAEDRENWEYWVAGTAGVLAVLSPFVFGFSALTTAGITLVTIGLVAMGVSGIKLYSNRMHFG